MTKETYTPKADPNQSTDPATGTGTAASRTARRAGGTAGGGTRITPGTARARQTPRSRRGRQISSARARRRTMLLFVGLPVVIIVVIIVVLLTATNAPSSVGLVNANDLYPASSQLAVGTKAPNFTLKTVDGKSYSLSSFKGKPVLVEFFAVWCPICQAESTVLNEIDATYGSKGLQTVAVLASPYGKNYEKSGDTDLSIVTKSDINWFISNFKVKHLTLIDPTFSTVNTYGASSYPGLYIIDKNGIIRYAEAGERPLSELSSAITPLL